MNEITQLRKLMESFDNEGSVVKFKNHNEAFMHLIIELRSWIRVAEDAGYDVETTLNRMKSLLKKYSYAEVGGGFLSAPDSFRSE